MSAPRKNQGQRETSPPANPGVLSSGRFRPIWPALALIILGLQVASLAWQLRKEVADLARRGWHGTWGETVRKEDPFYLWLNRLKALIPESATYVFLDRYEFGKEIEARYHLFPRRHLLLLPDVPASLLFHTLRQYGVTYLLVREGQKPPGPGLRALLELGALEPLAVPGPGLAYRVDTSHIKGAFYD